MNEKENAFWELIQDCAKERNAEFFMDSGEGKDLITERYEGENFSGWLIPNEKKAEFKKAWGSGEEEQDQWDPFYMFAEWKEDNNSITIEFNKY